MDIHQFLLQFGLTQTEIIVYLEALKHAHTSVKELANNTELKRPRIYHALETLEEKGLMVRIGSAKVKRFRAEHPEQLELVLKRRELELSTLGKDLKKVLPLFPVKEEVSHKPMGVEYFYGKQGLSNLGERVLTSTTKQVLILNPPFKTMEQLFDNEYGVFYVQARAKKNIHTKTIWQDMPSEKFSSEIVDHKNLLREMRIASVEKFGEFKTSILIFDNSVAIISYLPEVFGVLITSFAHAETMRLMWQSIWDRAEMVDLE